MLGRIALSRGDRPEAARQIQAALALRPPGSEALAGDLAALDEALDDPAQFQAFCDQIRQERPELGPSRLPRWHLEPASIDFGFSILDFGIGGAEAVDDQPSAVGVDTPLLIAEGAPLTAAFVGPIQNPNAQGASKIQNGAWCWHDPKGDCSYTAGEHLEIHAANGRGIVPGHRTAPCLLRSCSGDFACQAVCLPAGEDQPAMGGLLLWKDDENYLCLDRGRDGKEEISFRGCVEKKALIFGRGRLSSRPPEADERSFLRLERRGARVRALCSADGREWFSVGEAEFPGESALETGVHAIGKIDRLIYPGAYPEGTAIRFEAVEWWRE